MKISDILARARNQLEISGVSNSRLDSLILLTHALSVSKEQVIFNPDRQLDQEQQKNFFNLVDRRSKREPISHIIEKREFYGRDFIVSKDVLDPRPDSESLIELVLGKFSAKEVNHNTSFRLLEIGSGSGCLSITLLKDLKITDAVALDISEEALAVCQKNVILHKLQDSLKLVKSNLFESLRLRSQDGNSTTKKFDLIISNPPYIDSKTIEELQPEVKIFEPRLALDGGSDGLDFYRRIANEAKEFLCKNGKIILEIGFGQKEDVERIFIEKDFTLEDVKKDLAGTQRALCFGIRN